ncbi:hypothetical protein Hanom_Chr17g01532481 [Helianthus anomalus]
MCGTMLTIFCKNSRVLSYICCTTKRFIGPAPKNWRWDMCSFRCKDSYICLIRLHKGIGITLIRTGLVWPPWYTKIPANTLQRRSANYINTM